MKDQILKIDFLPDLSMPKYASRYGASAKERAGRVITDIIELMDSQLDDWIVLRYLYNPNSKLMQDKLKLFLRIHSGGEASPNNSSFVGQHLLSEFYTWTPVSHEDAVRGIDMKSGSIFLVQRAEEIIYDPDKDCLHYSPLPIAADLPSIVDKVNIDALFHSFSSSCLVDISVKPSELSQDESNAVLHQLKELDRRTASIEPERRDVGSIENISRQRDILASRFKDYYQVYFDTLYSGRICEFSVRVLSADKREGQLMARSIGEAFSPNGGAHIFQRELSNTETGKALIACEHCIEKTDLPNKSGCYSEKLVKIPQKMSAIPQKQLNQSIVLSRICCLVEMKNASRLLELPTSEGVYFRTIRIESEMRATVKRAGSENQSIQIGQELERPGTLEIGTHQMQKHLFVAGVTGSGKTTSILNILMQLWEQYQIPFLVFEPVKSEYRILSDTKGSVAKDIRIYSPGNERFSPFRFNPLEVPFGVTVEEHISALEECFAGAIPMGGPLPALIAEAIVDCYESSGYRLSDFDSKNKKWPTMKSLVLSARNIMDQKGYVGEVKSNLTTAIDVRLNSLCQRSVGRMFSSSSSFPSVDELLRWPTILEMDSLNMDQQNLLVLFLLTSIRERVSRKGPAKSLKHVIVLEEAHNLIGVQNASGRVSEDFADPRGHAARFLIKMLAEIRAYGEGIMVVDQSPAAIASEVLKNTSVKIVHRTVSEDDRDALAAAMLMDKYAHEELARLEVGNAFVYNEQLYRPSCVRNINLINDCQRPSDLDIINKISIEGWFILMQEKRLSAIKDDLENITKMLVSDFVVKSKEIRNKINTIKSVKNKKEYVEREWGRFCQARCSKAGKTINTIIDNAILEQAIREEVLKLGEIYADRFQELIRTVTLNIEEVISGPKKQK